MTAADYLAWEAEQTEPHEFVGGETLAMAGAEDRHVTVAMDMAFALRHHQPARRAAPSSATCFLNVAASGNYFCPDIRVTCRAADLASPPAKSEPKLIVEVLTPSTAAFDRGLKFSYYRHLPSLQEYALIDLDTRAVDRYTLEADGLWKLHPFAAYETVTLASVALQISATQLFVEI